MRRLLSSAALLCVLTFAASAVAQPKSRRRHTAPPSKSKSKSSPPPSVRRTPPPPPDNRRLCASRQSVLTQEQNRLDASRTELTSVGSELAALEKRIAELKRQRDYVARTVASREARVQQLKSAYTRECRQNESCQQYENLAASLERQADDVEREVAAARSEMAKSSSDSAELRREIDPLRREHARLQCNNLVAGSTAQSTIDRCAGIFSEWNRLQARVNQLNNRLGPLHTRYKRLLSRLEQIENRGRTYEVYLSRNCKSSPQLAKVRGYGAVRLRAEKLGRELDKLIDEAAKLRGIEITVTPR